MKFEGATAFRRAAADFPREGAIVHLVTRDFQGGRVFLRVGKQMISGRFPLRVPEQTRAADAGQNRARGRYDAVFVLNDDILFAMHFCANKLNIGPKNFHAFSFTRLYNSTYVFRQI